MKSFIAALRSLVLPFGATSGARIVIDGVNGRITVYDSTGTQVGTIDGTNGFQISGSDGSYVKTHADGAEAEIEIQPPTSGTATFTPGFIRATSTADVPLMEIVGAAPLTPVAGGSGQLNLGADPVANQTAALLLAQQINIGDASDGSTIDLLSPFVRIQGNDIGRGLWTYDGDTVASAAVGTTETVILTTPSKTFKAGRAYECRIAGRLVGTAGNNPVMRVRKTNAAGAVLATIGRTPLITGGEYSGPGQNIVFIVSGADVTATIALTIVSDAATTVQHTGRRWIAIYDVGLDTYFPDAATLT